MSPPSIVISGPLCAGKTTLAESLGKRGWRVLSARSVIARFAGRGELDREDLQRFGRQLEMERPGVWLLRAAVALGEPLVLDSVRTRKQAQIARTYLEGCRLIHLTARLEVRRDRFNGRMGDAHEFDSIATTSLETEAASVAEMADVVIDTSMHDERETLDLSLCISEW